MESTAMPMQPQRVALGDVTNVESLPCSPSKAVAHSNSSAAEGTSIGTTGTNAAGECDVCVNAGNDAINPGVTSRSEEPPSPVPAEKPAPASNFAAILIAANASADENKLVVLDGAIAAAQKIDE